MKKKIYYYLLSSIKFMISAHFHKYETWVVLKFQVNCF